MEWNGMAWHGMYYDTKKLCKFNESILFIWMDRQIDGYAFNSMLISLEVYQTFLRLGNVNSGEGGLGVSKFE